MDDGLDNIHLDLNDLRQRFEHKQPIGSQSNDDRETNGKSVERASPLHKSDSILARLQKYESVARSGSMDQESKPTPSVDEESGDRRRSTEIESSNQLRSFADLNSLKSQWEKVGPSDEPTAAVENHETREELASLRKRIGVGRSASLRQMYEQGERPTSADGESLPATSPVPSANGTSTSRDLAESMRRRFEQGEFASEHEIQYREKLRRETQEELNLVQEADTAAKEAKQIFHRLDKMQSVDSRTSHEPSSTAPAKEASFRRILSVPSETSGEVIKSSEPGVKDLPTIDTAQLQERYRFFEQKAGKEGAGTSEGASSSDGGKSSKLPPKPIALPRDLGNLHVVETPAEQIQRDPNVIRSSDVIDDRPKGETTKRMLNVFKRMEQLRDSVDETNSTNERPKPPPLRCITPPAEYTVDDEPDAPTNGHINGSSNGHKTNETTDHDSSKRIKR